MDKWNQLLADYTGDLSTNELVFVKYLGGYDAEVSMFEKTVSGWNELFCCSGQIGYNGLGKEKEGDRRTPIGVFDLSMPFGLCDDPGSILPYLKVHEHLYWCADPEHYNQLIDIREHPHTCAGERLVDFPECYRYAMYVGYNHKCIPGKGSAIFLHCFGPKPYTEGCIAIDEGHMITVLRHAHPGAKICIDLK